MKVTTVQINEFKSIQDSNPFKVGDITCLVGKNEAGKTAILQALYRLNPVVESDTGYDVTDDYPRADVEDYRHAVESQEREKATVVSATFTLEPNEIEVVSSLFGEDLLKDNVLTLSRGYEGALCYSLNIDESVAIKHLVEAAELPTELATNFLKNKTLQDLKTALIAKNDGDENSAHLQRLEEKANEIESVQEHAYTQIRPYIPQFLYFDEYYQMRGYENLQTLKQRIDQKQLQKQDHPLLGLLALARIDIDQLLNPERTQTLMSRLEGASNHLNKKVLKYWSQNKHIELRFDVRAAASGDPVGMTTGHNIWAQVYDSKHRVSTPLGSRSRGFVWFFSFLAWFDQKQKEGNPLILLLDEPGLFLHGKAQEDLLRYMEEELQSEYQVIYTTHSPFMIDPTKFERVRIVQDRETETLDTLPEDQQGTKVLEDVLDAVDDSLFPLQGALGYEIYQTLFVGPNNLVVEGVSDLLGLQSISMILERAGRTGLDSRWTITPVGGSAKVPTYVALLGSQKGMTVATLIDIAPDNAQKIDELYKKKLLKKKNVVTYADFLEQAEADLEDIFGVEFYLQLVNNEYKEALDRTLSNDVLESKAPRLIVRLEQYFKSNPLKDGVMFNHYRPIAYFSQNVSELEAEIPKDVLDRFEKIFTTLNTLL